MLSNLRNGFTSLRRNAVRQTTRIIGVMAVGLLLSGCLSVKHYVNPADLPQVTAADLKPLASKQNIQLFFEYQTNGATNAKATDRVGPMVADALKRSSLFAYVVSAPETADRKLFVTINNISNMGEAQSKGFATGLTFGLAGSTIADGLIMTSTYDAPGTPEAKHSYKTAIYSTIGATSGPAGLQPVSEDVAIHSIVDSFVFNLLNDMTHAGELR